MEEGHESLEAILFEGRHGLVEIGQPQLQMTGREGLQSADLLSCLTGRAAQADGGQATRCSAVVSCSTEMRLIASTSVGPFTAPMPNLNDMTCSEL